MNVIADIAGQINAFKRLIAKMPPEDVLCVGDLGDRGPDSRAVFEEVQSKNYKSLMGNHEHMLIDWLTDKRLYDDGIYLWNGGIPTLENYGYKFKSIMRGFNEYFEVVQKGHFPKETLDWLNSLPLFHEDENFFVSHAPWKSGVSLEKACTIEKFGQLCGYSLLWNREGPQNRDKIQIFGHNSHWGLKYFGEEAKPWAVCIDQSRLEVVTGIHLPTMQVYTEPYDA